MKEQTAADIMKTPVIVVNGETSLRDAATVLTDSEVSGALVIDHQAKPIGIVSLFDIASYVAGFDRIRRDAAGRSRGAGFADFPESGEEWEGAAPEAEDPLWDTRVADVMTPEIVQAPPEASISELARLMYDRHIHRVLIFKGADAVGIVSTMDLIGTLIRRASPKSNPSRAR